MMEPLTLQEAIEFATLGVDLARAFREVDKLPLSEQRKGVPAHDTWRELALRFNAMRRRLGGVCPRCHHHLAEWS